MLIERQTRGRLARSRKAPRDVVTQARMIELSWGELRVQAIANELRCSQKTMRRWLNRFHHTRPDGRRTWADRAASGGSPRPTRPAPEHRLVKKGRRAA
ncbi:helix-turn-helix domain-containing protein [Streptomyces canus]|uniref:helix-turn-helix domain-containing protein n=1 Tax=Streptomyces canus TaxID=58343 RepID=UPI0036F06189